MPPIIKITKEAISEVAFEIIVEKGLEGLNARAIAKKLNCSIQPIFSNYKTMDDLRNEVIEKANNLLSDYILEGTKEEKPYKGMGKSYIRFAKDYPKLFQLLLMSDNHMNSNTFLANDSIGEATYADGGEATGFDKEKMRQFHFSVWIFTHGIATLCATRTCDFSDNEIDELLKNMFKGLLKEYEGTKKNG